MKQQFQTKKQPVTMYILLLALVIVIAINVKAGTLAAGQCAVVECNEDKASETKSAPAYMGDLPWSPFLAFIIR